VLAAVHATAFTARPAGADASATITHFSLAALVRSPVAISPALNPGALVTSTDTFIPSDIYSVG